MPQDELTAFAVAIGHGVRPIKQASQLFPDKPSGYVNATKLLRCYAWNKVTAMGLRLEGKIATATQYETICDRIYGELPDYAKGW